MIKPVFLIWVVVYLIINAQLSVEVEGVFNLATNQCGSHKATIPDDITPRLLKEAAY